MLAIWPAVMPVVPAAAAAVSSKGKRTPAVVKPCSSDHTCPAKWLLQLDSSDQQEVGEAALYMRYSSEDFFERD
jgi:hypothetical protein